MTMKFVPSIKEEPVDKIELSLEYVDSTVRLVAKDMSGTTRTLMEFHPDGSVYRMGSANIGEFNFDAFGRIIISNPVINLNSFY